MYLHNLYYNSVFVDLIILQLRVQMTCMAIYMHLYSSLDLFKAPIKMCTKNVYGHRILQCMHWSDFNLIKSFLRPCTN